ncbi:MAG: hypothetical protein ACM3X5_08915, partial [Bacillota bacterium]
MSRHSVAVIAVHGVGVHTPGDMARDVATLLQGANKGAYSPFLCADLEIPVERPETTDRSRAMDALTARAPAAAPGKKPWYVRSEFVARKVTRRPVAVAEAMAVAAPEVTDDIRFTQQAVDGAEIDAKLSIYRTVVLRGERDGASSAPSRERAQGRGAASPRPRLEPGPAERDEEHQRAGSPRPG